MVKWIMICVTAVVVCGTFVAWKRGWLEAPEPPPQVQVRNAADYCAQLAGYDDGASDDERLAMAVATMNLAAARGTSTCDIYKNFDSLIGEGTWTLYSWWREPITMYTVSRLSTDRKATFNQTGLVLERYMNDPGPYLAKMPWLECVTHYIRSTWQGGVPWPDYSLREKMRRVWVSPTVNKGKQAELFCPKEKSSFNFELPGLPHPG